MAVYVCAFVFFGTMIGWGILIGCTIGSHWNEKWVFVFDEGWITSLLLERKELWKWEKCVFLTLMGDLGEVFKWAVGGFIGHLEGQSDF